MAESIITLGIGASPASLTPFITGDLLIDTYVAQVEYATVITADGATVIKTGDMATGLVSRDIMISIRSGDSATVITTGDGNTTIKV